MAFSGFPQKSKSEQPATAARSTIKMQPKTALPKIARPKTALEVSRAIGVIAGLRVADSSNLSHVVLGEEPLAAGKAVWLEEEAEDDGAVGRHRLVPVAGRPPHELPRPAYALVILDRALEHERLLQGGVLVQRDDGAGIELEQRGGDSAVVGIEHLDADAGELGLLPRHAGDIEVARGELRRVLGLDIGVHDGAGPCRHGAPPLDSIRLSHFLRRTGAHFGGKCSTLSA